MIDKLEHILIQMNSDIMDIENRYVDALGRLEAKKAYIIGVFKQLDHEFDILEQEYEILLASFFDEEEQVELFEQANKSYEELMGDLFKLH